MKWPSRSIVVRPAAVAHWNAWFDCLLYIRDKSKHVLQMILRLLLIQQWAALRAIEEGGTAFILPGETMLPPESVKAATVLVTIGPIILIYPYLQRYFVKGIFVGSLKG